MKQNMDKKRIYLDTYVLQKDNRIRLPKVIEGNMEVVPGKTFFDVFFDAQNKEIVLKVSLGKDQRSQ